MFESMVETAEKGSTRLPDFVLTMKEAIRLRSSWGARVTSRTRPVAAPDGSYTVAPRSSESGSEFVGSVCIRLEHSGLLPQKKDFVAEAEKCFEPETVLLRISRN